MQEDDSEGHIRALFAQLVQVLQRGDVHAFQALTTGPDPFQEDLFRRQSQRLREGDLRLALQHIERGEDAAELRYDVLDAAGNKLDSATVSLVQESLGWFILEL